MTGIVVRTLLGMTLLATTAACVDIPHAGASGPTTQAKKVCAAADSLPEGCTPAEDGGFKPTPDVAGGDYRGNGNREGCWTDIDFKKFKSCSYGSKKAKYTVALVGNSHMAQYLKSFTGWTEDESLRIVTFLIPQCFATEAKIDFSGRKDSKGLTERCYEWGKWARREAAEIKPDLIVTSERTYREPVDPLPAGKAATWRKGYRDYLKQWTDDGLRVTVVRDNPVPDFNVPNCLRKHPRKYSACGGDRAAWLPPDPVVQAAESLDTRGVDVIDLTRYMCNAERCPAVLAGMSVYRDHSHLSGTWVAALEPYLKAPFMKILKAR